MLGNYSFKRSDIPKLIAALYSNIWFSPSKVVCLFSDMSNTIFFNKIKSPFFLLIKLYFSKCGIMSY